MKYFFLLLIACSFSGSLVAQSPTQLFNEIALIIKAKNEKELSKYLAPKVEVTINKDQFEYKKPKALLVLTDFLNEININSYEIKHISNVDEKGLYAITKLHGDNIHYNSNIYLSKINDNYYIREIYFEHEISKGN